MIQKEVKIWIGAPKGIIPPIKVSQYDTTWQFVFTVYKDDTVWDMSGVSTIALAGSKEDGTAFIYSGSKSGANVIVNCGEQMTSQAGRVECELQFGNADEELVSTANFELLVEKAPLTGYRASENEFNELSQLANTILAETGGLAGVSAEVNALRAAVGTPLIAATAAAMTDHNKIYVYTGSEDGYTAGNWYYWNGSAWTSGGVYNSSAINTDKTLAVSDSAADAKVTGDAIMNTNAALKQGYKIEAQTVAWAQGGRSSSTGAITSNATRIRTSAVLGSCDALYVHGTSGMKIAVAAYVRLYEGSLVSTYYVGWINFAPLDGNNDVIIPMTKGLAYCVIAAYTDDSDILPAVGDNITIYKCYAGKPEEDASPLCDNSVVAGKSFSWVGGSIRDTTGEDYGQAYMIRTVGYIPVTPGRVLTIQVGDENSAFAYFYRADQSYIGRAALMADAVATPVEVPVDAAYARFIYGNTTATGITVTDGMDLVKKFSLTVSNDKFEAFLNQIGYLQFNVVKGNWKPDGSYRTISEGLSTDRLFELPAGTSINIKIWGNWVYSVWEGDEATNLTQAARLVDYSTFVTSKKYVGFSFYGLDNSGEIEDKQPGDFQNAVLLFKQDNAAPRTEKVHDVPENIGVLNVINRAYQMTKITWSPAANLPTQVNSASYPGYFPANGNYTGMVYSSTRNEGTYVPQCVSFQTFMTALKNPHSYLYDPDREETNANGKTYYGCVCSSLVGYCYGVDDVIATTISFDSLDGMEVIENQSPYGLKLGDSLNKAGEHIVIVTDIVRNSRGVIDYVELSEAWKPVARTKRYTPAQIQSEYFEGGYVAHRYHYIYKVPYTPSPWINLDNETGTPTYNANLSPRRGEDANWRPEEPVEIDIMDSTGYTHYKLYKNNVLQTTTEIPAGNLISLSNLGYGSYKVCLTDGTNNSDPVYFDIIDSSETYSPGTGSVTVTFSSANATPASISFCNSDEESRNWKGVTAFHILTDAEIAAGEATVEHSAGTYLMKVMYKTRFGLYSGNFSEVTIS